MTKEAAFLGLPQKFEGKIEVFPPKVGEIAANPLFGTYRHILTISQEEIEDEYVEKKIEQTPPTPLEFLLINSYHDKNFEQLMKEAFFFFLKQKVTILYEQKMILVGDLEKLLPMLNSLDQLPKIDSSNYFDFQNFIRASLGEKPAELPNPDEHPKIRRIKALARYRDKIKAKQGGGINFLTSLASICCMGIGITPLNIGEMSYAALGVIMSTYQNKEKYEIDIASLQAGADSKKINPKYWIKNLD